MGIFSTPIPPTGVERLPGIIPRASTQSESHFGPRTAESFNPSTRYSSSIVYKSTAREGMRDTRTDSVQPSRFYRTLIAIQNTWLPGIDQEKNFRTTSRYFFNKRVWRHGLLSSIYHNANKFPSLPSGKNTTTAMTAKSLSGFYQGSIPGRMTQSDVTGSRHSFSESRRTANGSSLQNPIRGFGDQPNSDLITVRRQPLKQPALRSETLVFQKPVNREKSTANYKETGTVSEYESKSITDKTEVQESIKKLGTREIHSIAEKVIGLLERRISIEKDRRGIR
jgi:hypothetical protein